MTDDKNFEFAEGFLKTDKASRYNATLIERSYLLATMFCDPAKLSGVVRCTSLLRIQR
jgi:hypothetical protein